MKKSFIFIVMFLIGANQASMLYGQKMVVKVDQPIAEVQPTLWGLFFEDINFAADGGLYAELIKNRSFEFYKPLMGWEVKPQSNYNGSVLVLNREETQSANPRFARVTVVRNEVPVTMKNSGFRGMGVKQGLSYHFSVLARRPAASTVKMKLELQNSNGETIGQAIVEPTATEWTKYEAVFTSSQTDAKATFTIIFEGKGIVDVDMVSLFPSDTWKNRPGGLRADLVQLLYDLKPGFLRFPGGCIVEGHDLGVRYQWKKTVGKVEEREMIVNRWNTEFKHRLTPDYYQSFGLGFYEYFLLSRDIGAEPLPILNCGMACQFNTAELVPMDQLKPYIQDALDLIEFANGSTDTKWGKLRAGMGSPEPFNMKFIGIGNEQWGPQYIERYIEFEKAIKAKYPEIILVSGAGPSPDGEDFEFGMKALKDLNAEIIDEHYYRPAQWFFDNTTRYDSYDRNGPKIFAGEYAAQSVATASPENQNNWLMALSEAAFMTGLERNADVVHLSSYAPLFAHVEGWQWTPDLIWFDNLNVYGTPNYYVQKLYSNNKGTHVVPLLLDGEAVTGQDGLYASAVMDQTSNELIVKVVNRNDAMKSATFQIEGVKRLESKGKKTVLRAAKEDAVNSIEEPRNVYPVDTVIQVKGTSIGTNLDAMSLTVIRIKMK